MNPQSMSNEHSSQNTFEKIFLKKKDKNLPDLGAISQVYIFWTCRIALQTLYLGTTPALAITGIKTPGSTADRTDITSPYRTSTILSECWRQHVRNISDNFERGGIPPFWSRDFGWYQTLNSTEPSRRFLGLGRQSLVGDIWVWEPD